MGTGMCGLVCPPRASRILIGDGSTFKISRPKSNSSPTSLRWGLCGCRNTALYPDWLISGGESGGRCAPGDPHWVRDIIADCRRRGVAPFHKQWGTYPNNPLVAEQGISISEAKALDKFGHGGGLVDGSWCANTHMRPNPLIVTRLCLRRSLSNLIQLIRKHAFPYSYTLEFLIRQVESLWAANFGDVIAYR